MLGVSASMPPAWDGVTVSGDAWDGGKEFDVNSFGRELR